MLSLLLVFALLPALTVGALASGTDDADDAAGQRLMDWAVTGPMGGDVRSLVIDPQDPRRLYLG
ncbi:MAG TPA: hypothetical protein VFS10_18460, partial [Pyrinomonadaceae bacterium]|nr:hypothetical protein [Pyrinomonadaceae bacterium]